ncbi:MAG: hypothetical protein HKL96_02720 [Phycisphaerales bacterium]|nr:hypothetical protein [Phycisphaerales bacterium]
MVRMWPVNREIIDWRRVSELVGSQSDGDGGHGPSQPPAAVAGEGGEDGGPSGPCVP